VPAIPESTRRSSARFPPLTPGRPVIDVQRIHQAQCGSSVHATRQIHAARSATCCCGRQSRLVAPWHRTSPGLHKCSATGSCRRAIATTRSSDTTRDLEPVLLALEDCSERRSYGKTYTSGGGSRRSAAHVVVVIVERERKRDLRPDCRPIPTSYRADVPRNTSGLPFRIGGGN